MSNAFEINETELAAIAGGQRWAIDYSVRPAGRGGTAQSVGTQGANRGGAGQ